MANRRDKRIDVMPAVEGVYLRSGRIGVTAVRDRKHNVAVSVSESRSGFRRIVEHIPFIRGALRLFFRMGNCFAALKESEMLEPCMAEKGTRAEKHFAGLFRIVPEKHVCRVSTVAILLLTAIVLVLVPLAAQYYAVNMLALKADILAPLMCVLRMVCVTFAVKLCSGIRILRRLSGYTAAANKVVNAYGIYGHNLTEAQIKHCSKYSARSDGAFLFISAMIMIVAATFLPETTVMWRVPIRLGLFFGVTAVFNEFFRIMENARARTLTAMLRDNVMRIQAHWLRDPSDDMIEVALCAFEAMADKLP